MGAARRGTFELDLERRMLVVVRRRLLARRLKIPFEDVETSEVVGTSRAHERIAAAVGAKYTHFALS